MALSYSSFAAALVAYWKLDETNSPYYTDSGPNSTELTRDPGSTPPLSGTGIVGNAAQLNWQSPGPATRLFASGSKLQNNSFGFSFWLKPAYLNPFDNFMAKEMNYTNAAGYLRVAWQVHLLDNNGSGAAPIELVVRGDNRTNGNFFGSVVSAATLALFSSTSNWVHVAGGYDAASGKLSLFVNGAGATNNGTAGADCSDGSSLSIGSTRNGMDFVTFSAATFIDDVQLYDGLLTATDVAFLRTNPGQSIGTPPPFTITQVSLNSTIGDVLLNYQFLNGWQYAVDVSSNLLTWVEAADYNGTCECNSLALSTSVIARALGNPSPSRLFMRLRKSRIALNGN